MWYLAKMKREIFLNEKGFKRVLKMKDFSCRVTKEMRSPTFNLLT